MVATARLSADSCNRLDCLLDTASHTKLSNLPLCVKGGVYRDLSLMHARLKCRFTGDSRAFAAADPFLVGVAISVYQNSGGPGTNWEAFEGTRNILGQPMIEVNDSPSRPRSACNLAACTITSSLTRACLLHHSGLATASVAANPLHLILCHRHPTNNLVLSKYTSHCRGMTGAVNRRISGIIMRPTLPGWPP